MSGEILSEAGARFRRADRLLQPSEFSRVFTARRVIRATAPLGAALARGEAVLRGWTVAGLALLLLTFALGLAMVAP